MTLTAAPPSRGRRRVRLADGAARLRLMALAGIATVLVTRAYLAATGYPRIGGGGIHIGHVLWGGLSMIAALTVALVWVGGRARTWIAVLGGVGTGLFVDEVGKYLTATNDYFYRPAAAIIYLVFATLLVVASLLGTGDDTRDDTPDAAGDRLAAAAQIAADGLVSGLTVEQQNTAIRLLDGCSDPDRDAVRQLLSRAPVREPGRLARSAARIRERAARVADLPRAEAVAFALLVPQHLIVSIVFTAQAVTGSPHSTDAGAITASAVTRGVSTVLVLAAAILQRRSRRVAAYRLARAGVLIDLLVTQLFNFHDSQFAALAELPWLLLALAFLTYRQPE